MKAPKDMERVAGLLLHPTSLPSGKLDADAYRWIDWLADAGVRVWQMLPLGVPLDGRSPYQCASAFAVDPKLFPDLSAGKAPPIPLSQRGEYAGWYAENAEWVDDYALFMALKQQFGGQGWHQWPSALRMRNLYAIEQAKETHADAIRHTTHQQFQCYRQWQALRQYAAAKGVQLFGDMPIFVAYDSADVWARPERFRLDENGTPTVVTGVPPDYFSATGQRWGNPHYDWAMMQSEGFHWWKQRLRYHFEFFDLVRIDHFRGLAASWIIPATCETAIDGFWEKVPGDALLQSIQQAMGNLPLVAEDLGSITPDVTALRDKYGLPGMSVLQFGFDHFEDNPHKPQNVRENTVYYTGTHDNDTLLGWFGSLDAEQQAHVLQVLKLPDATQLTDAMLDTVLASPARLVVVPLQDLLRLGSAGRMNTPGTVEGNWQWQFAWDDIPDTLALELHTKLQEQRRTP